MACTFTATDCQAASAKRPRGFNWTLEFARRWARNAAFGVGVAIRPSTEKLQTGLEYVSDGGQSNGRKEPAWPTDETETVEDGAILWTPRDLTVDSLIERIATSTWSAPDAITIDDEEVTDTAGEQVTSCSITGGTPGEVAEITNTVTTTLGHTYVAKLLLTIE